LINSKYITFNSKLITDFFVPHEGIELSIEHYNKEV